MEDAEYMTGRGGSAGVAGVGAAWRSLAGLADCLGGELSGERIAAGLSDGSATQSSLAIRNLLHEIVVDGETDPDSPSIVAGVSELVTKLEPRLLTAVVRAESDSARRVEFLEVAARRLSIRAVVRLTDAAAAAFDRTYPAALRTIVHRLARRALTLPSPFREEADDLLRAELERLFRSWVLRPRGAITGGFEPIVDRLERRVAGRSVPEADRILEMALECDAAGGALWIAVAELTRDGSTAGVIERIKNAPPQSATAAAIMKRIATPQDLQALLHADSLDGDAVDALLRGMGMSAARVLLEELVESKDRMTRRFLMERLAGFGPEVRPLVEGRLKDRRWFVQRNMLALLRSSKSPADPTAVNRFIGHKDARVRREAVLWGLETPATRDETLVRALGDVDSAVMRPSLQAARSGLPAAAVPVLAKRILDSDFPPEFRIPAIQLLGRSGSILAVEALLHFAQNGTSVFGKPRLAGKTPELLAALRALAHSWPNERRSAALLARARKSKDRDIVNALSGTDLAA